MKRMPMIALFIKTIGIFSAHDVRKNNRITATILKEGIGKKILRFEK